MKTVIFIVLVMIICAGILWFFNSRNNDDSEEINIALSWAGINTLPPWARSPKVETKGNPTSREFLITFSGTADQIKEWVQNEPVFRKAQIKKVSDTQTKYILEAQGGAQYAEVLIDHSLNKVIIRTYWS